MFEFDFFKLVILAMIGLLVLGPEKLPRLAARIGHWMGRARSIARQLHTQLEQEVLLEEERQRRKKEPPAPAPTTSEPAPSSPAASTPEQPVHEPPHGSTPAQQQPADIHVPHEPQLAATAAPVDSPAGRAHD